VLLLIALRPSLLPNTIESSSGTLRLKIIVEMRTIGNRSKPIDSCVSQGRANVSICVALYCVSLQLLMHPVLDILLHRL
jgi:hypothetical protein